MKLPLRQLSTFSASSNRASPRVIFSGIQPTGTPHLGNFLGALSNWVHLQRSASPEDTLIYSVVGLHAITVPQEPHQLRQDRRNALTTLLAIGIDPSRSILFHQDEVQEHAELAWILGCLAPMGRLNRMTAYKSKSAKNEEKLGLFAYPVLQAADILAYKASHVPVGEDQRQHLELSRELAQIFNHQFGSGTFPLPQDYITPAKRILSLRDPSQKMSKSAPDPKSRILLTDSVEEIAHKIRKSITDSLAPISFDTESRPGVSNLLNILHACRETSVPTSSKGEPEAKPELIDELAKLARTFEGQTMAQFKDSVAQAVEERISPIRSEFNRIRQDEGYLDQIAKEGAEKARAIASRTLVEVKTRIGLM